MHRPIRPALAVLLLVIAGCGGPATGVAHGGSAAGGPPAVTGESYHEVLRNYWRIDPEDPARLAWRDALVAHLDQRSAQILERGSYDLVVEHLAELAGLLSPQDLAEGRVPEQVAPLARWVVERGEQRGDEGRVMGALLLLSLLEEGEQHASHRRRVADWGREARASITNPIERYGGLIQVWEQHEQLAPAPDVLETLARLYAEQRDALVSAFGPEGQGTPTAGRLSFAQLRLAPLLVQRAPLDVAAVYLRHGDLSSAIHHVQQMQSEEGIEARLVRILRVAQQDDEQGAHALGELAQGFARARPEVTEAICRLGARRFPQDESFPLCLARVAMERERVGTATAWYAEAVRLAPDQREVYDEALGQLDRLMEQGLFSSDVSQSRAIAGHALQILEERARRWPQAAASVTRAELLLQIGRAEMSAGNVAEARQRLQASLDAEESREAHVQLGLLLERTGQPEAAAAHYRQALDRTPQQGAEGTTARAELLEHLGDSFRRAGNTRQAERMYRQALDLWDGVAEGVRGPQRAVAEVRRGILNSWLGRPSEAAEAFVAAMEAAPGWREPYAAILSHLVVSQPNVELAQQVLRRANYQLTLEREWKVYFALWVQAVAARASSDLDPEVVELLGDMALGDDWSARLAHYGRGEVSYEQLEQAATSRGERAEAAFYEGARRLGVGDAAAAREYFERVLETGMVNFYEYAMAQELLGRLPDPAGEVAEQGP